MSQAEGSFHSLEQLVDDAKSNIDWLRRKMDLTLREVAITSQLTEKTVWYVQASEDPKLRTMALVLEALGADPRDLLLSPLEFRRKYKAVKPPKRVGASRSSGRRNNRAMRELLDKAA